MSIGEGLYHRVLRVMAVVAACILVFDSGMVSPLTKELSDNTITFLASSATGVSLSVPPNELNTITAELTRREQELDAREAELNARTVPARDFVTDGENDYSTYILSAILFLLTTLIVLNYLMDWMRSRRNTYAIKTS